MDQERMRKNMSRLGIQFYWRTTQLIEIIGNSQKLKSSFAVLTERREQQRWRLQAVQIARFIYDVL